MLKMTVSETAAAVNGSFTAEGEYSCVSIDSRDIPAECMYIAIKGERFDGHDFIPSAIEHGAACIMSDRDIPDAPVPVIKVEDTRRGLIALAAYYRAKFDIPVVGVTGSVGKTTTKEMVAAVLRRKYSVLATEGNLNNDIGLPRMCLRLDESITAAVLEMGMSGFGEISLLTNVAKPSIGIITNIGVSHIEKLGSREGILKAKLEILEGMEKTAPLILNADDDMLMSVKDSIENPVITCAIENMKADCRAMNIVQTDEGMEFTLIYGEETLHVSIPAVGKHNVYNALVAFVCGKKLGLTSEQAVAGLKDYVPSGMRQKIVLKNEMTFIEDCYNASPDSIKAALGVLTTIKCTGWRIAVLGEMMELGSYGAEGHRICGECARKLGVDLLYVVGGENAQWYMKGAGEMVENGRAKFFETKEELAKALIDSLKPGDAVLFKASRSVKLEQVIEMVENAL